MTEWIATLALVISLLLLFLNYRNQVELRHGEITHHRSVFLVRASAIQQRMTSVKLHIEAIIPELLNFGESVEEMQEIINSMTLRMKALEDIRKTIDEMDTQKNNKSAMLMMFQKVEHDLLSLEKGGIEQEEEALSMLQYLRSLNDK